MSLRLVAVGVVSACLLGCPARREEAPPPLYFSYPQPALDSLRGLDSSLLMDPLQVYRWQRLASRAVAREGRISGFDAEPSRVYALLALAWRDAAALSWRARGRAAGSLDPVSRDALCLLLPTQCPGPESLLDDDAYSRALAALVLPRLRARLEDDARRLRPAPRPPGKGLWSVDGTEVGRSDGSRPTWIIASARGHRSPAPAPLASLDFARQVALTRAERERSDDARKLAVARWAAGPGTTATPGLWLRLADESLEEEGASLARALRVHGLLALTLADAVTAVFDSKYAYWVPRPYMMDPRLTTIMPTPAHPSYPAGHSALSEAAAETLSRLIPSQGARWRRLAREAGLSRVWGGIHYPMDHEAGTRLGRGVARETLTRAGE